MKKRKCILCGKDAGPVFKLCYACTALYTDNGRKSYLMFPASAIAKKDARDAAETVDQEGEEE